ncbi:DUF1778 domain-containing protein [Methylobacterium sp. E-041]|uniref:type II toxin-antitoxin system TacA family antitoxin n=1 Tax=unclassified Methylobacterium TaxID=2615210 RepID=UPI001FBB6819|nr:MULTISPECIES: DUF1778 domain-containing protein [unclassified Methylobacterium]MCJ2037373.1 DUF1778 domain-containing protein [Methylobacterium sp. J-059]MCJ2108258.1 DUF1778 domain-containing protein [Methylobacterium sp. E-041]
MLAFRDDVCAPAPRSERMEQRTTVEARSLIERAARSLGVNTSEFVTVTATRAARDTLQSYERTALKPEAHQAFMAAFDATEPTPALLDLMSLHAEVAHVA